MTLPEGFIVVGPDATREECIAAWVKNLRNPNVRQGRGRLINAEGAMCCLGVACATLGLTPQEVNKEGELGFDNQTNVLPKPIAECIGARNGGCRPWHGLSLWEINDLGTTFFEIADLIESRPPGLFVESST